ncbi:Tim44/TimA family putative adaptor protein [Blastomonas sp.]|uniref:Tim44/TimA family putative adaptor protein n=1 Tax=Blastomonas sp. TaxID=1909299 RepID=UPI00359397D5
MVAAFLGLRLYSVLGKRTGHEQEPLTRTMDNPGTKGSTGIERVPADDNAGTVAPGHTNVFDITAEPGIRQMLAADRSFDVGRFREGAKAAYGMILEAFWAGKREDLRGLCDDEVYESFAESIEQREKRGETLENRLVRIDEARIVDAEYDAPTARITVRFDADIAAVVRGADGELIAGSMTDAVSTHDLWTFARNLRSDDPNWLLVETDQA